MIKNFINKIKNKIDESNKNFEEYQKQLVEANTITSLMPYPEEINQNKRISPSVIVNACPDINETKAKLILNVLPMDELHLCVLYAKEVKTNNEYYLVPTTRCLWIMSQMGYIKYEYTNLKMTIIKSGLLSKVINLNNLIFDVTGDKIDYLNNLINNQEFRVNEITNINNTLFGLIPTLRIINEIGSGISIDNNKNIIFHTKEFNKKYHISQLDNYELYLDNNSTIEKKTKMKVRITAGKNACYEMKLKITPKNEVPFIVPILPRSTFEKMYQNTSESYMNSFKLSRELIDILDDLNEKHLNGY